MIEYQNSLIMELKELLSVEEKQAVQKTEHSGESTSEEMATGVESLITMESMSGAGSVFSEASQGRGSTSTSADTRTRSTEDVERMGEARGCLH
ncbi:MAG: hypothetical protein ACI9CD_001193 [Candidatus Deianiraeaceae bacterium]|jgi:hypothetical protein